LSEFFPFAEKHVILKIIAVLISNVDHHPQSIGCLKIYIADLWREGMSQLTLYLLGSPRLEMDEEVKTISRWKVMALLTYLAVMQRSHRCN
jgi:hypothetical protein